MTPSPTNTELTKSSAVCPLDDCTDTCADTGPNNSNNEMIHKPILDIITILHFFVQKKSINVAQKKRKNTTKVLKQTVFFLQQPYLCSIFLFTVETAPFTTARSLNATTAR